MANAASAIVMMPTRFMLDRIPTHCCTVLPELKKRPWANCRLNRLRGSVVWPKSLHGIA